MRRLLTWQQRLDGMDHSKGTSNAMIQTAMNSEIVALRAALDRVTAHRDKWKLSTKKYRNLLLKGKK